MGQPLHLSTEERRNRHVKSFKSDTLKWSAPLCGPCNHHRTQPHDRACEELSELLRSQKLNPGDRINVSLKQMLGVHLYFVKQFGFYLVEAGLLTGDAPPIDVRPFADAILSGTAHPHVYLKFGYGPTLEGHQAVAGMSDLEMTGDKARPARCSTGLNHNQTSALSRE